jgi:hypothetical protein
LEDAYAALPRERQTSERKSELAQIILKLASQGERDRSERP